MKKKMHVSSILTTMAFLLVFGFIIRLGADYYQYLEGLKTYPFYFYVFGRGLTFLLASLFCIVGSKIMKAVHVKDNRKKP